MKKIIALTMLAVTVSAVAQGDPYKVRVPLSPDDAGAMAFLVNFDTEQRVDSTLVSEEGEALFRGTVDEPFLARVIVDGARLGQLIVENGSIVVDPETRSAYGSPLNDESRRFSGQLAGLEQEFATATPERQEVIYKQYMQLVDSAMWANIDNPFGYQLFISSAMELEPAELEKVVAENPALGKYQRVQKLLDMNRRKTATSAGAKFADFDVNGQTLGQYVGKDGKYLLVDFWASWCGPCKRQIPVIKEIAQKYADKLNVLGVAVWDEPDATRRAISDHGITWPNIIDAQTIPTDIYGISGIPCIMLIAPDGTIVFRDLQGDQLKSAVASILGE
ncbi:MAG: AhpC/TSA family protein [Muribaculaceae bacterium]|nr:AhpC/TSA family protein [Muribaculaceae bacterium]